jgi:DNA-binding SARP family transcriptional activator
VKYQVLGPIKLVDAEADTVHLVQAQKMGTALAALLAHVNQVVSTKQLIEEIWDGDPPLRAVPALHVYISQLRKLLHEVDAELGRDALVTRPPGYELRLDPAQLDLAVLEELHGRGRELMDRQDYRGAADLQRRALGLWRGPLLSDTPHGPLLDATAVRLSESTTASPVSVSALIAGSRLTMASSSVPDFIAATALKPVPIET